MCHPSVLARFACIDLFFLVRTTYIDLRHAVRIDAAIFRAPLSAAKRQKNGML